MTKENKDLYYLEELEDYKVAQDDPDVRGWAVRDTDERNIGTVDGLLVSRAAQRVVYLDIVVDETVIEAGHEVYSAKVNGVHEFLNKDGEDHLIVPIGLVTLDMAKQLVRSSKVTHQTFAKTKRFSKGMGISRDYELSVHGTFVPGLPEKVGLDDPGFYNHETFKR